MATISAVPDHHTPLRVQRSAISLLKSRADTRQRGESRLKPERETAEAAALAKADAERKEAQKALAELQRIARCSKEEATASFRGVTQSWEEIGSLLRSESMGGFIPTVPIGTADKAASGDFVAYRMKLEASRREIAEAISALKDVAPRWFLVIGIVAALGGLLLMKTTESITVAEVLVMLGGWIVTIGMAWMVMNRGTRRHDGTG